MSTPLLDAHNHLQNPLLKPHLPEILRPTRQTSEDSTNPGNGQQAFHLAGGVVNGTHPDDWADVDSICSQNLQWLPSFGVHPWLVNDLPANWFDALAKFVERNQSHVGIGEIGLDRWKTKDNIDLQLEVFSRQWLFAVECNLPITVHCLRAWGLLLDFLKTAPPPRRGFLLHAYGGSTELIPILLKHGAWFSFNGSFLHRPNKLETFRKIPSERLLIESDAPSMGPECPPELSLPPAPDGTPVHHPGSLAISLLGLVAFLQTPADDLASKLNGNFRTFFSGPQPS